MIKPFSIESIHLTQIPPPKPPKKAPPVGYDMRTLRKQLEYLHEVKNQWKEMNERAQTQSLLYEQNNQLWRYLHDLLHIHNQNAAYVQDQVRNLHEELTQAYNDRKKLADELQLAVEKQKLMDKLRNELDSNLLRTESTLKLQSEAEKALLKVREENASLEESLQVGVDRLQVMHLQLDDLREQQGEVRATAVAEEFFRSNKTILRSAYRRFKQGVQRRLRLNRIETVLKKIRFFKIKKSVWLLWRIFVARGRLIKRSARRRGVALKMLCVARWKVYTALEKLYHRAHKRFLLSRNFKAWKTLTKESISEKLAQQKLEATAKVMHKKRIFSAWRRVAVEEGEYYRTLSDKWPLRVASRFLGYWLSLCQFNWRRRGNLIFRFFRQIRYFIVINNQLLFAAQEKSENKNH